MTQISISLPSDLVAKIDQMADAENRNRSNFIATQLARFYESAAGKKLATK
ncbi:MAG: CopG family ribbon-helix-helix protein [Opitutales bacterium]